MSWYLGVMKKYAVFDGRARRKEYWMFFLMNVIIYVVLAFVGGMIGGMIGTAPGVDESPLVLIYQLAVLIPALAVGVRRMHDTGHSGWWILFPIVNLVFAVTEGQKGENKYGLDPKSSE
jgi:uncharacterized membrane protein YhaH (DUF805 family)